MTNSPTLEACLRIGSLPVSRARALSNYVMALAAHGHTCKHAVELSETPFCHYTYSNLTKVVTNLQITVSEFQQFISPYLNDLKHDREGGQKIYQLAYDFTKQIKAHSVCLPDRQYLVAGTSAGKVQMRVGLPLGFLQLIPSIYIVWSDVLRE